MERMDRKSGRVGHHNCIPNESYEKVRGSVNSGLVLNQCPDARVCVFDLQNICKV